MQYDKKLHMLCGFLITIAGSLLYSVVFGLLTCFAAGLIKELRDDYVYGGFDRMDLAATMAGGLVGCVVVEALK